MLTVVTGAPCSGKTTHVRTHARSGDVIIDFDQLAKALGSPVEHEHPHHIRMITIDTRKAAINSAIQQHHKGATVWIIDTNPAERMVAYRKAGAKVITMTADTDELHRRADASRPPLWHALIEQYLVTAAIGPTPSRRRH